jgi:hypothetical protein
MKTIFPLLFILLYNSCTEEASTTTTAILPAQLHGQWRNVYIKLDMRTYKNSDSSRVLEVNEENWEKIMQMKPIRTYFWYNGTYNSLHYDLRDSLVYNPAGRWFLRNDTLVMTDTFPEPGMQYRYRVALSGDMAEFWGMEDLDGDGQADDHYYGTQRKYSR